MSARPTEKHPKTKFRGRRAAKRAPDLPMVIHAGVMVLQTADAAQLDKLLTRRPVRERLLVRLGPNRALFPTTARPELMKRLDAAHIPSHVTTVQTLMEDA